MSRLHGRKRAFDIGRFERNIEKQFVTRVAYSFIEVDLLLLRPEPGSLGKFVIELSRILHE